MRNTFDRKIVDFVLLAPDGLVLAIVELDDASHDSRARQDAERDAMLEAAGYRVVRVRSGWRRMSDEALCSLLLSP